VQVLVVVKHRTTKGVRLSSSSWVVAFAVGLFTLVVVASCALLFFAAEPRAESTSFYPSAAASAVLEAPIAHERASLDNDLDNDSHVDGIADSLGAHPDGIANPLVCLVFVSLLIPAVGGGLFLLSLYKLPMVGRGYCLPPERPG
jgi:hypothetical protein